MFAKPAISSQEKNIETITALKYSITIYDGISDWVHGGGEDMVEFFIPSHKVCFNHTAAFKSAEPREQDVTEIQISKDLAEQIAKCANARAQLTEAQDSLKSNSEYKNLCDNQPKKTIQLK